MVDLIGIEAMVRRFPVFLLGRQPFHTRQGRASGRNADSSPDKGKRGYTVAKPKMRN
jgi:hypothetical protein